MAERGKLWAMADQIRVPGPGPGPGTDGVGITTPLTLAASLPRPIVFVMAGGGAHGCVQWGLLQALYETDIRPDALIGTSAGALTCAVVAEDPISATSRLTYVWSQLDLDVLVGDSWLSMISAATKRKDSIVDNSAEKAAVEAILTARDFSDLALPMAAVATDLATGEPIAIDSGELIPALLASSAIPGVLPPVTINGRRYVDGLASANLPARLAVERGAGSVIVLGTGSRAPVPISTSTPKVVSRVNAILNASQRRGQLVSAGRQVPVVLLPTPADLGAALDFRETISAAGKAYDLGRNYLYDLLNLPTKRQLSAGIYARPSEVKSDAELAELAVEVPDSLGIHEPASPNAEVVV
jgi:NTE family protein